MDRKEARKKAQAIVKEVYDQGHISLRYCTYKIYDEVTMDWSLFWMDDEVKALEAAVYMILRGDEDA